MEELWAGTGGLQDQHLHYKIGRISSLLAIAPKSHLSQAESAQVNDIWKGQLALKERSSSTASSKENRSTWGQLTFLPRLLQDQKSLLELLTKAAAAGSRAQQEGLEQALGFLPSLNLLISYIQAARWSNGAWLVNCPRDWGHSANVWIRDATRWSRRSFPSSPRSAAVEQSERQRRLQQASAPCLSLEEERTLSLMKLQGVGCSAMTPTAVQAALPATWARALPCTDAYLGRWVGQSAMLA